MGIATYTSGLNESQGLGADTGGIRVGNIVGTDTPGREQEEEDTNGKEPVQIMHSTSHCCKLSKRFAAFSKGKLRSWKRRRMDEEMFTSGRRTLGIKRLRPTVFKESRTAPSK